MERRSLIRPLGTFSREKAREKADREGLLPLLLAGEGARRADEGQQAIFHPANSFFKIPFTPGFTANTPP